MSKFWDKFLVYQPYTAIPSFFLIIYCIFAFSMQIGGIFQSQIETWTNFLLYFPGVGRGLQISLSFIPVIWAMFFSLGLLEESGYMSRALTVMDNLMSRFGLPGRTFLPMIIGLGCNVQAIVSSRALNNRAERILTIMMAPFMSCGARLTIYAIFVAAFFQKNGSWIIFSLYLLGILMAWLTGLILKATFLHGKIKPKINLPLQPYKLPSIYNLFISSLKRTLNFVYKTAVIIIPVCTVLTIIPVHILEQIGRLLGGVLSPMGITSNNWEATVALLTGTVAKETIIGSLGTLYCTGGENQLLGVLFCKFGSAHAAYAYLIFVLLYFPCVSVLASIAREINWRWAALSVFWTNISAYCISVLFFQLAEGILFGKWLPAIGWVITILTVYLSIIYIFKEMAQAKHKFLPTPITINY